MMEDRGARVDMLFRGPRKSSSTPEDRHEAFNLYELSGNASL